MKIGEPIDGHLLYPVYAGNRLAIPMGSVLQGSVVRLQPDRSRRIRSRLRGDFTPFRIPVVRFNELILPDGTSHPIVSENTSQGAPILRLTAPAARKKGSLISQQISQGEQRLKDQVSVFTSPGRGDRLLQFAYSQLPYHPQRIQAGTAWTVELAQPLELLLAGPLLAPKPATAANPRPAKKAVVSSAVLHRRPQPESAAPAPKQAPPADPPPIPTGTWRLHAYLKQTISSATAKTGDTFQAVVAEPVFGARRTLEVPEGSLLIGTVTQAKPARSFGRKGKLRFSFKELKLPDGFSQGVEGTLAAADSNKSADLQIDSEGGVQPKSQNRVIVPLILSVLASRGLDNDGDQAANGAVASNGLGIVGRVIGITVSSRNVAAGIGFYGAALSVYDRWIARGGNVVFVKDTRIEVSTTLNAHRTNLPTP